MNNDFSEFLKGYVECLLWSSTVLLHNDENVYTDQFELS